MSGNTKIDDSMLVQEHGALATPIAGVLRFPLREIATSGGAVLHMLRAENPLFQTFGEIYFSENMPGGVKPWKRHLLQTQLFAVPVGLLHVSFCDDRENSPTHGQCCTLVLGRPGYYSLLRIPPLVWYTFSAKGNGPALIANVTDLPHTPAEVETAPFATFDVVAPHE